MLRRLLKWFLLLTAALIVLGALAFLFRAPLLTALANVWIVNEPPVKADAIVVLGGGIDTRPAAAARLYRDGWAPKILVLQPEPNPAQERGLALTEGEITRRILESEMVAPSAIELLETKVTNTFDESRAVASWAQQHHAKTFLVPTDAFHTRRAEWIVQRQLTPVGAQAHMIATPPRRYALTNWWQSEFGIVDFQNESLKYIYYRIKH